MEKPVTLQTSSISSRINEFVIPPELLKKRSRIEKRGSFLTLLIAAFTILVLVATLLSLGSLAGDALWNWQVIKEIFTEVKWEPNADEVGESNRFIDGTWGGLAFIYGTFFIGVPALIIAIFFGVGIAIILSEYTPTRIARIIQPIVEFVAAIPSIIFAIVALNFIGSWIQGNLGDGNLNENNTNWFIELTRTLGMNEGKGILITGPRMMLTVIIVLGLMATPVIASISFDAMRSTPKTQRDAALAFGTTKLEIYKTVVYPHAKKSIFASILLAFGRVIGETMVAFVVLGSTEAIEWDVFSGGTTLTSGIALYFAEASRGTPVRKVLFSFAIALLIMSFFVVWVSSLITGENKTMMRIIDFLYKPIELTNSAIEKFKQKFIQEVDLNLIDYSKRIRSRMRKDVIFMVLRIVATLAFLYLVFVPLFTILADGFHYFNREGESTWTRLYRFFIEDSRNARDIRRAGDWHARPLINGTALYVLFAMLFSFPIGTFTAIYLYEFAEDKKPLRAKRISFRKSFDLNKIRKMSFKDVISLKFIEYRTTVDGDLVYREFPRFHNIIQQAIVNISAIPSIVMGLFVYALFVAGSHELSDRGVIEEGMTGGVLLGGIALGIMMIPIITTNTIEALRNIPETHKQSALALGATRWEAFWKHRFPYAFPSIITGYILAVARIIGETAPLLFLNAVVGPTSEHPAFNWRGLTSEGYGSLTYEIWGILFGLYTQSQLPNALRPEIYSVLSLTLLSLVLLLNIIAYIIRTLTRRRYEYNGNI